MDYTQLGRTGLKVSRLCLGTMNFGPHTTEADSFTIMDKALELGLNFFDTANVYGGKMGEGVTEQIVGRWLAQGNGRREKIVLATKVYGRMSEWPNDSRLSAYHIRRACEDSLRRLQTDHLDLYQMHHIDRHTPWDEIWQAMETLVQQGKVLYVGSSNFAGWHLAQAQEAAQARHFLGLVSEQSIYNLNDRLVELEVIPACRAYGLGLIPWSPLAGGLLGGTAGGLKATGSKLAQSALNKLPLKRAGNALKNLSAASASVRDRLLPKLKAQLDPALDLSKVDAARQAIDNMYQTLLKEEKIVLSRAEKSRVLEAVVQTLTAPPGRRSSERQRAYLEKHRAQMQRYEKLCASMSEKPADVALAWLLHNPVVTAPIIGPRTLDQFTGSLRALEIKLSAETLKELDAIWPGPGGEAPEAYAW